MQTVRYSTLSLTNREQIFLQSVLVMYNTRGNASWNRDDSESDVLIIGRDAIPEEVSDSPATIKVALSLNLEVQKQGCKILYVGSPIKATELIDKINEAENVLKQLNDGSYNPSSENVSNPVRLFQWPKAEVVAKNSIYPILAALLTKRAMALEELASISRKPEDICRTFIEQVIDSGDAEYIAVTPTIETPEVSPAPKRGLLDRIRAGLGLFQK